MSGENQTNRKDCYVCGGGNSDVLDRHHIVPRRHGGSDRSENLVDVCPTCHRALESLYDKRFYNTLGVDGEKSGVGVVSENEIRMAKRAIFARNNERRERHNSDFTFTGWVGKSMVVNELTRELQDRQKANRLVEELMDRGEIYEPKKGCLECVTGGDV